MLNDEILSQGLKASIEAATAKATAQNPLKIIIAYREGKEEVAQFHVERLKAIIEYLGKGDIVRFETQPCEGLKDNSVVLLPLRDNKKPSIADYIIQKRKQESGE